MKSTEQLIRKLKEGDAALVESQEQIIAMLKAGKTMDEIKDEMSATAIDGMDLVEFLKADTMEKRLNFVLRNFVGTRGAL